MNWPRALWPRRVAAQIAACVILAVLVSQLVTASLLVMQERPHGAPPIALVADQVALIIAMLDATPAADRRGIGARLRQPHVRIDADRTAVLEEPDPAALSVRSALRERLANPFNAWLAKPEKAGLPVRVIVDAQLTDGDIVRIEADALGPGSIFMFALGLFYIPAVTIALILLTIWATLRITAPLRAFSEAAERLGNERSGPPLPETGPVELRRAARSFNQMQEQLKRFIADRTRTLAAISHDLRTPITRLRLRVEAAAVDCNEQRKMLRDLDQMDAMISSALSFLRDGMEAKPSVKVDVASLLQSACDEFSDLGHEVRYVGIAHLSMNCRPELLARAVANLLENATKYGTAAIVDLKRDGGNAIIHIDDNGPGIPETESEKVFEPFYRLDTARVTTTGGFGLGLSIAKMIVELHNGKIELANLRPSGTRVSVELPVASTKITSTTLTNCARG